MRMTTELNQPASPAVARRFHVILDKVHEPQTPRSIWEHPVIRALGAFALTTVLGTVITTCWQTRQWTEQQDYTARAKQAETQLSVTKAVTEKVSDAFSCSNHVVFLTLLDANGASAEVRNRHLPVSIEEWIRQNRTWRVSEATLVADTTAHFSRPSVHQLLAQVLESRRELFKNMTQFIEISRGEPVPQIGDPRRKELQDINSKIYNIVRATTGGGGLLPRLTREMIAEVQEDQRRR
jgi:hypothetical protein